MFPSLVVETCCGWWWITGSRLNNDGTPKINLTTTVWAQIWGFRICRKKSRKLPFDGENQGFAPISPGHGSNRDRVEDLDIDAKEVSVFSNMRVRFGNVLLQCLFFSFFFLLNFCSLRLVSLGFRRKNHNSSVTSVRCQTSSSGFQQ